MTAKENAWASAVRDLQSHALMTLCEIGERVGLAESTVCDLLQGRIKAPGGDAALRLHALHRRVMRRKRSLERGHAASIA